jgi:PAS domain S-box-containing protein
MFFDAMPGYLSVQDRELRIIDANRKFREDFGDFEGRTCYQVYKQRSEKCEICPVDMTFRDGQSHSSLEQVSCLDGKQVSVLVNTTPVQDENGTITAVIEMSTDITEIQRLQQQLRDSQARYRALFEEVPCYITIQDRDLNLVEANRRFREDFGTFLGCKCFDIYKHRDEECLDCPVQRTFDDGKVHTSEEIVTSRTGEQRNTLVYTAPIRNDLGQIQAVMEMSTDITRIRELQSQLESTGLLIGSISHGIKGLLTGLDGGFYLVNTGMKKDDAKRLERGWEMVQRNVDRIRSMVLNILYYAKEREPNREAFSPVSLAEEVSTIVTGRATEHGVEIERHFDTTAGELNADPDWMRSLLVNLMENSIDACRVDKKKDGHRVAFSVDGDADEVRFGIEDNGIGMDRETREKAFSLFFSSKGSEGTGLGLFIANNIAQKHGGSIELTSEAGRGTRFVVRIPRKPDAEEETMNPVAEKGVAHG